LGSKGQSSLRTLRPASVNAVSAAAVSNYCDKHVRTKGKLLAV